MAEGADGVELDVRLCATGELVVCHDPTLERVAGRAVRVDRCSLMALRRYDLGRGERVPTLDEVFAALPAPAFVNVEIKGDGGEPGALAQATAEAVAKARAEGRVVVSSFEPAVLRALREIWPRLPRGLLVPPHPLEASDVLARARGVLPTAIHPHYSVCSPERVRDWRVLGLRVNAWTVDAGADVVRVAHAGVDAVITNVPAVALSALYAAGFSPR